MDQPRGGQQPPSGTKRPRPPPSPSSSGPSSPRAVNENHRQGPQGPARALLEATGLGANGSAGALDDLVPFPVSLGPLKQTVDHYTVAKIRQFAAAFARKILFDVPPMELEKLVGDTVADLQHREQLVQSSRFFRLVLRHDCQSTGCAERGCLLCQFNPSRLCQLNLKPKYLIGDFLKAKCKAPLRVELIDERGSCVPEGLADNVRLQVHVLDGVKYKHVCPNNTLLSHDQLNLLIVHSEKALLMREGQPDDMLDTHLVLDGGRAQLSDLKVTTSSEVLLNKDKKGKDKAPPYRLLVWAVDPKGNPVPNVTYVVSEEFVVATKRVRGAQKSDIPSTTDHVSKLVHIGDATVGKMLDMRKSAEELRECKGEEQFEISIPDHLNHIDKVGQFQELVELCEKNSDLKDKICKLLKLSPEKWEEVSQHAQSAVADDNRPRVWWIPGSNMGLLFACKNGAVALDHPTAVVTRTPHQPDDVKAVDKLGPELFSQLPDLKSQAVRSWYTANHGGWGIYHPVGQVDRTRPTTQQADEEAAGPSSGGPAAPAPPSLPLCPAGRGGGAAGSLAVPSNNGQEGSLEQQRLEGVTGQEQGRGDRQAVHARQAAATPSASAAGRQLPAAARAAAVGEGCPPVAAEQDRRVAAPIQQQPASRSPPPVILQQQVVARRPPGYGKEQPGKKPVGLFAESCGPTQEEGHTAQEGGSLPQGSLPPLDLEQQGLGGVTQLERRRGDRQAVHARQTAAAPTASAAGRQQPAAARAAAVGHPPVAAEQPGSRTRKPGALPTTRPEAEARTPCATGAGCGGASRARRGQGQGQEEYKGFAYAPPGEALTRPERFLADLALKAKAGGSEVLQAPPSVLDAAAGDAAAGEPQDPLAAGLGAAPVPQPPAGFEEGAVPTAASLAQGEQQQQLGLHGAVAGGPGAAQGPQLQNHQPDAPQGEDPAPGQAGLANLLGSDEELQAVFAAMPGNDLLENINIDFGLVDEGGFLI